MTESLPIDQPMTPTQKIKHLILINAFAKNEQKCPEVTAETIDRIYDEADESEDGLSDFEYEMREGEVETGLATEYSRHYESKAVAAKMPDGSWVGWTYWYGGGKHGVPEDIDWMDDAYDLDCVEEEKLVIVRTFSKVGS